MPFNKKFSYSLNFLLILVVVFLFSGFLFAQQQETQNLSWMAEAKSQVSPSAWQKLPANVRMLINAPKEFLEMKSKTMEVTGLETDEPGIGILVKSNGNREELESAGAKVGSHIGDIYTVRILINRLGELASIDNVLSIAPSMRCAPELDSSIVENRANLVHQADYTTTPPTYSGYTGKDALVVTIDTGIDWKHGDFMNDSDGTSRILFIWDQNLLMESGENHPPGFTYGVEYTQADINDEIDGSPNNYVRTKDYDGHGTHVMGTIAGDGSATGGGIPTYTYVGMAPQADMVVVSTSFYTADIIDGIAYAMQKADLLGKPVVVNLSLGSQYGAHDGTSLFEQAIDNAVNTGNIIVVISAGNEGTDAAHGEYIHAEGTVNTGTSATTDFEIPTYTPNSSAGTDFMEISLWYQGGDDINVKVTTPNGYTWDANTGSNNNDQAVSTYDGAIYIENAVIGTDPNNGDRECFIQIWDYYSYRRPKTGIWTITVTGNTITESGHFDSWIYFSQLGNKHAYYTSASGSNEEIIANPGSAEQAITVAAHTTKDSWIDYGGTSHTLPDAVLHDIAYFSCAGPTRDDPGFITGRQKPDISASGFGVIAARSSDASGTSSSIYRNKDGVHIMFFGTSMSAPHVTGAVALMLDKDPTLSAQQVKTILRDNAHSDSYTGSVPNYLWGYGKLDIDAAIQQIQLPPFAVDLFPSVNIKDGLAGNTVSFMFKVKNLGASTDNYQLIASNNVWQTTIWDAAGTSQINNTGPLASDAEFQFMVKVEIPSGTAPSSSDFSTIRATSLTNSSIQDHATVITRTPAEIPWSDNFPTTVLDTIKWNFNGGPAEINSVGSNEPSSPYSLNLNGADKGADEVQSQAINLVGKNNVGLAYYYQLKGGGDSPETGDDLWVDYLNSSGKWVNLMHHRGSDPDMTTYSKVQVFLPADAYHSQFKIRFRNIGTIGLFDDWFIDDVLLDVVPTPDIVVSPDSIEVTLMIDDSTTRTVTIQNIGDTDLLFDIQGESVGPVNNLTQTVPNLQIINIENADLSIFGPDGTINDWREHNEAETGEHNYFDHENSSFMDIKENTAYPIFQNKLTVGSPRSASSGKLSSGTYLSDDFEDGDYNGWLDAGYSTTKEVTNLTAANNTNYSLRIYNSSISGHLTGLYQDFNNIQPGYVSFYIRSSSTSEADGYFVLDSPIERGSGTSIGVIFFYAKDTGYLYINGNETVSYTANTWYHIEFKDIDWNAKTFDYYVNGSLITENLAFRNASVATRFEQLQLYNFSSYSQAWWDEIVIRDSEMLSPTWLSYAPSSGTIPPLGSETILLTIRTKNLSPDTTYRANLIIKSNDPDESFVTVPVILHIRSGLAIWVPDTSGSANTTIDMPIFIEDVTNQGIFSAGMTVKTDHVILTPLSATTTGTIAQGWGTPTYTISGGEINIAMAGSSELIGDGKQVLVYIQYQTGATADDSTIIELSNVEFNEGYPAANPGNGKFKFIDSYDISGNVRYFFGNRPVPQALMSLTGYTSKDETTDADGNYILNEIPGGVYKLTPGKSDDVGNSVSAYDASLVLRYSVGAVTIDSYQKIAADVSGNGEVSAFDASWILRYNVGLVTQFPVAKDWTFVPTSFVIDDTNWSTAPDYCQYNPLNKNETNQDFWGIVYGDVSGNWMPTSSGLIAKTNFDVITVSPGEVTRANGGIVVPVSVDKSDLLSAGFTLKFNPSILKATSVTTTDLTSGYTIVSNIEENQVRIALAGVYATNKPGNIVNIHFQLLTDNEDAFSPLEFGDVFLNDGDMTINVNNGEFKLKTLVPLEYALSQNYPNPFNPTTSIQYQLPEKGHVVLKIFNMLGEEVRNLIDAEKDAGYYEVKWDGKDNFGRILPSGIYLSQLQVGKFLATKKMLMLK